MAAQIPAGFALQVQIPYQIACSCARLATKEVGHLMVLLQTYEHSQD
jgi:hypothetical protein